MKQKRTFTRRQQAVRWMIRLTVVVLLLSVTGIYDFLPSQSMRKIMQQEALENIEIVHREWGKYAPMNRHLLQIGENGDRITMTADSFHPLIGWYSTGTARILDPQNPEQYYSTWDASKSGTDEEWACIFGFVPDGEQPPTFRVGVCDWYAHVVDGWGYVDGYIEVTPTPTIPVKGGMCYLEQYGFSLEGYDDGFSAVVTVYENGEWVLPAYRCGTSFL